MDYAKELIEFLAPHLEIDESIIEVPPKPEMGDLAVPMFKFAKTMRKSPVQIAKDMVGILQPSGIIEKIVNVGPYLNFYLKNTNILQDILGKVVNEGESYGYAQESLNKSIVVDYSSPNIAKPFGIAHIRSTVIGNSLYKIFTALGYKTWRINHLGDWGTQFGKLMVAYTKWGDSARLNQEGIHYLVEIYIKVGEEAKKNPELDEEARQWFKKLEDGDAAAVDMWQQFRDMSLREFKKYYSRLGVEFDHYQGEAFYNDRLEQTVEFVKSKIETTISEGALIVDLTPKGIKTPLLLRKSDGATTYHTRDIAAALYRLQEYSPEKVLYVVGSPQSLHFKQLFTVLGMLGEDATKFEHIPFGNMTYEGVMMSTRKGNFIELSEVLDKAVLLARKIIEEKNPALANKEQVAEAVGIGAIIFGDLSNDRNRNIDFQWDKALSFEGDTAPYLQYSHARICSIKRKLGIAINPTIDFECLTEDIEIDLTKKLGLFHASIVSAAESYKPSTIAVYLLELAQLFNKFYSKCRIKDEVENLRDARLLLADATRIVLKNGLNLLGIHAPEEM